MTSPMLSPRQFDVTTRLLSAQSNHAFPYSHIGSRKPSASVAPVFHNMREIAIAPVRVGA